MEMTEGKEREKETEEIFETIMTENFPKSMLEPNHRSRKPREQQAG